MHYLHPFTGQPTISTHLENTTLVTGSNHTFVCAALGNPSPTFGWRFNGDRILQDTPKYSNSTNRTHSLLTVYNLMANDNGNYTCQASNRYGTDSTSAELTVLCEHQYYILILYYCNSYNTSTIIDNTTVIIIKIIVTVYCSHGNFHYSSSTTAWIPIISSQYCGRRGFGGILHS